MCGFVGIYELVKGKDNLEILKSIPELEFVKNRGPDQQHFYSDDHLALFHSRLVVASKPEQDIQPFTVEKNGSKDVLLYGGEIYNWRNLQAKALGDTSALYREFSTKGVDCLKHLRGDFSFFFKSSNKDSYVYLVRDHLGVKPLYYSLQLKQGNKFLAFSTNLKTLVGFLRARGIDVTINVSAQNQYNVFRYVLDPKATLINEVSQVPPGSYMLLDRQLKSEVRPYWEIPPRAEKTFNQEEFEGILNESISMRVPEMRGFGTFLSGGLDSGFLTLKSKESPYFKGTFSLDVPGIENERERLEQFLRDHNVKNFSHSLAIDDLLKSSTFKAMDVPTGDSVVFLLNSLFKFSSQKANVFLSGDGADEVFGGYVHHKAFFFGNLFQKIFPGITHRLIFSLLKNLPSSFWEPLLPYKGNLNTESLSKLILFLKTFKSPVDAYVHLVGLEGIDFDTDLNFLQKEWGEFKENAFSLKELLRFDLKFWGPNYSLNKVDYIAGFNGIEVRVPYYDNKLVEYVISHKVPLINLRQDKILLRQAAARDNFKISDEKKSPFRIEDNFIDSKFNGLGLLDGKREVCSYNLKMWKDSIRL